MTDDSVTGSPSVVTLHAGELLFGRGTTQVNTLLGSCVAVTLFHPTFRYAGICHFALPFAKKQTDSTLDPRYGDDCFMLFANHAKKNNILIQDFETHIIGGGNMLDSETSENDANTVGQRNARRALEMASHYRMNVLSVDVGEFGYRKVKFNTRTGELAVSFTDVNTGNTSLSF